MITEEEIKIFDFLNDLQKGGTTNMFGAVPDIVFVFPMSKGEARMFLTSWMTNYNPEGYNRKSTIKI